MDGVLIRAFADGDHAEVMELWCSAWEATVPGVDLRANWSVMLAQWDEMLANGGVAYVAERQPKPAILGFIVLSGEGAELQQIAVAPSMFGTGVSDMLMTSAKARARETGGLALRVNTFNTRAIRFYQRHGFEDCGECIDESSGLPVRHYAWRLSSRVSDGL